MKSLLISILLLPAHLLSQNLKIDSFCTQNYFGYRFELLGDFDGNGINDFMKETILKHGREVRKFYPVYDFMEYQLDDEQACEIVDKKHKIPNCHIATTLGLFYAEALPDINCNGKDEIGFVYFHADMSSVNSYRIMELNDQNVWEQIYRFEVRDWEFPDQPWYTDRPSVVESLKDSIDAYSRVTKLDNKSFTYDGFYQYGSLKGYSVHYVSTDDNGHWFEYDSFSDDYRLQICCDECDDSYVAEIEKDMDYFFCFGCRYKYRVIYK